MSQLIIRVRVRVMVRVRVRVRVRVKVRVRVRVRVRVGVRVRVRLGVRLGVRARVRVGVGEQLVGLRQLLELEPEGRRRVGIEAEDLEVGLVEGTQVRQ